jgi:hypothetical protein
MRKILIIVFIVIVTMSILWIFTGAQIARLVDRFGTRTIESKPVHSISYEGSGERGSLVIDGDGVFLFLAPLNPHVGSTKDNQLALAHGGKVFAFGNLRSPDALATEIGDGDVALLITKESFVSWPEAGAYGRLNRNVYTELSWTRPSGAKLKMIWWLERHADEIAVHLIRVEITNATR